MQLVLKDGQVVATHDDVQQIAALYPGCEVAFFDGVFHFDLHGDNSDLRTDEQRAVAYRDRRRLAYPSIQDQLDMIYWDKVNGTTGWQDAIAKVKATFPKGS